MIGRKRVDPGFDIGEVLHKKLSHVRVDLIAIRDRQIGTGATPRFLDLLGAAWPRRADARQDCAQRTMQRAAAGWRRKLHV